VKSKVPLTLEGKKGTGGGEGILGLRLRDDQPSFLLLSGKGEGESPFFLRCRHTKREGLPFPIIWKRTTSSGRKERE